MNNKIYKIIFLIIIAIGSIFIKNNISMAVEKTFYIGNKPIKYKDENNTISGFMGQIIKNISNYDCIKLPNQTKSKSFYCVSKDRGLPTGEMKNDFNINGFIEISPTGYVKISSIDHYNNGVGRRYNWGYTAGYESYYKELYYILAEENEPFGYNRNHKRQQAVWADINEIMNDILGYAPVGAENNIGDILTGYNSFLENAKDWAKTNGNKPNCTVRVWYLNNQATYGENVNDFYQSFIMVAIEENNLQPPSVDPPVNPQPVTISSEIKFKKFDADTANTGIDNIQILLTTKKEGENDIIQYSNTTRNGGECVFNLELPFCYNVWEYNDNPEYPTGYIYVGQIYMDQTGTGGWSSISGNIPEAYCEKGGVFVIKNMKNHPKGTIKLTKYDYYDNPINGIYFDLLKVDDKVYDKYDDDKEFAKYLSNLSEESYSQLLQGTRCTGGGKGILEFNNLEYGKYILRETNFDKSLDEKLKECLKRNIGQIIQVEVNDDNNYISSAIANIKYGGVQIQKKGQNDENLSGVGFKLYKEDENKKLVYVCTLADTDNNGYTSSSSNLEDRNSSIKLKNDYGVEEDTMYTLEPGKYYLYEYKNPNPGYNVKCQGQYYDNERGAYIGKININPGEITYANDLNFTYKDPNDNNREKKISYGKNEQFISIDLTKFIEEYDKETDDIIRKRLKGAGFKLLKNGKEFYIRDINSTKYKTEFFSDENGDLTIDRIPINSTYTLYESTFPSWIIDGKEYGIDPEIQPGYDPSLGYVKIATIKVESDGTIKLGNNISYGQQTIDNEEGDGVELITDTKTIKDKKSDSTIRYMTYRRKCVDNKQVKNNKGVETKVTFWITNRRYMKFSGYVWEDMGTDTKNPGNGDNLRNR